MWADGPSIPNNNNADTSRLLFAACTWGNTILNLESLEHVNTKENPWIQFWKKPGGKDWDDLRYVNIKNEKSVKLCIQLNRKLYFQLSNWHSSQLWHMTCMVKKIQHGFTGVKRNIWTCGIQPVDLTFIKSFFLMKDKSKIPFIDVVTWMLIHL